MLEQRSPNIGLGPAGPGERPGEDRREHQERRELVMPEAVDMGEIPGGRPSEAVSEVGHDLLGGTAEHAADDRAAVHAGDADGVGADGSAEVDAERRPTDLVETRLVFGEHDAGGVSERCLVVLVAGEPEHVSKVEPQPPADGGVGVGALTHHAGAVVETERSGRGAVENDQGVGASGVARVFGPVGRVEQHLGKGKEYRQVFGSTPRHHGVDGDGPHGHVATGRAGNTEYLPRIVTGVGEKRLDPVACRRHDGVAVAPPTIEKVPVHVVNGAGDDDVQGGGLARVAVLLRRFDRQAGDHTIDDRRSERGDEFIGAHGVDMALGHGERKAVVAVTSGSGESLALEALADDRHRGDADGLGGDGGPHHGGRAGASTPHAGNDRIYAACPQIIGQSPDACLLVAAVEVAEDVVADDVDAGEPFAKLGFQRGEQFVTAEEVVPQEGDTGALERREPVGSPTGLHAARRSRPDGVVHGLIGTAGHCSSMRLDRRQPLALSATEAPRCSI